MRFQVPQFIETESKIVGPFTLRQFLFLAVGAVIIFILRYLIDSLPILIIASLPVVLLSLALAFYNVDGIPFYKYLLISFSFLTGTKRYIYHKDSSNDYLNINKKDA